MGAARFPDRMAVNVTQAHIDVGDCGDGVGCALAMAASEVLGVTAVVWSSARIRSFRPGCRALYEPVDGRAARNFINAFDMVCSGAPRPSPVTLEYVRVETEEA